MGQSMLDCPITNKGVRMTQLELNLNDDWHCSTCEEFTKPDEWTDFDNRVCINCASENRRRRVGGLLPTEGGSIM